MERFQVRSLYFQFIDCEYVPRGIACNNGPCSIQVTMTFSCERFPSRIVAFGIRLFSSHSSHIRKLLRRPGLGVGSSWAAGVALLADHVVLEELRIVLELFLELKLNVSWFLQLRLRKVHLQYQDHQPTRRQRTPEGTSATRRTP